MFCFFATCSHSFSLAPTRHLKLHLGWFPWNAKWNPHIFLSDKMQPWIPRAKHNGSNFSHSRSLSLALSLLIFLCWTECCIVNKTPEYPRCRLELESLGWHVGWVKAVSSALDGFWDQAGVFINLNDRQCKAVLAMTVDQTPVVINSFIENKDTVSPVTFKLSG